MIVQNPQDLKVRPRKEFAVEYLINGKLMSRDSYNPVPAEIEATAVLPARIEYPQYFFHSIQMPSHPDLQFTPFCFAGNHKTKKNIYSGPLRQLLNRYFESRLLFENYTTALVDYVKYIHSLRNNYAAYNNQSAAL